MPAGCNYGPNSPLAGLWAATACAAVLQSLPVSCHFRGCKVPLFRIVSGAISSELALPLPFTVIRKVMPSVCVIVVFMQNDCVTAGVRPVTTGRCEFVLLKTLLLHQFLRLTALIAQPSVYSSAHGATENAGMEIAGLENAGPKFHGWTSRGTGKRANIMCIITLHCSGV